MDKPLIQGVYKDIYEKLPNYPGDQGEVRRFLSWYYNNLSPSKSLRKKGHRAKGRKLSMAIQPNSGLPLTLHASLASTFDRHGGTKTIAEFLEWYVGVKGEYDPEMFAIYQRYEQESRRWIGILKQRRQTSVTPV